MTARYQACDAASTMLFVHTKSTNENIFVTLYYDKATGRQQAARVGQLVLLNYYYPTLFSHAVCGGKVCILVLFLLEIVHLST